MDNAEELLEAAGYSTEDIGKLKKNVGNIQKITGKTLKFTDNSEIVAGVIKEYADNKIWSTVGKELVSDFERDENVMINGGRLGNFQ